MLHSLIAYDADGNVIATLDHMVARDAAGNVSGLIHFEAHEAAGGKLRDIWEVEGAAGSATWPEWLGGQAHDFSVELDDAKRITALVHRGSGHRRERTALEAAIASVQPAEDGSRDIRHLVGGPGKPLILTRQGKTKRLRLKGTPVHLPVIGSPRG